MTQLLQNAVYGTALILAVAVLRGALKDRLLPEARLALWAVCLFRLFTPVAPASALSFWGLFGWGAWELPVSVPAAPAAPTAPTVPTPPTAPTFSAISTAPVAPAAPTVPAAPSAAGIPWGAILVAVWITVGVALAARYVLAYARTRRAVGRAIPLGREDARYAALPKCARLREGPMEGAPLTFGVTRPTVVLTPGLAGPELACVLAHEGVHARRRDNLWHYAAAAALTVFWWDPAVWLMARLIRRDVELSCDRAAVRRLGADRRAEYARVLVTLSTQAEGGAFCHGFGPKRTEERIISVMKYKKATVTGIALTLALVLAVTVGFASDPGEDIPDEDAVTDPVYDDMGPGGLFGYSPEELADFVQFDPNDADSMLKEYKALLERLVAQGERTQTEADEMLANMEALIERAKNGEIEGLMFNKRASGEVSYVEELDHTEANGQDGMYICIREDCGNNSVHEHDGVMYKAWRGKISMPAPGLCTDEDCPIQPSVHSHDVYGEVHYVSNDVDVDVCGVEGCTIQGTHYHYDPEVEDHAGDAGEPIACPMDAIDKDFYQKYGDSHHSSDHHSDGHHSDSHH